LLRAGTYLELLAQQQPAMYDACQGAMAAARRDMDFLRPDAETFLASPSDSIDYAVMEHTDRGAVVPLDCGWSDIGSWSALCEVGEADGDGNVVEGDVLAQDTCNSYIRGESRLVATLGVDNLVVVETPDAVLVADRNKVQDVKAIVTALKAADRSEATVHQRVFRPWGSYESLVVAEGFQVKRIIVQPGQTLSLQKHFHRAEHWVVVRGTAEVTRGEETFSLTADQSTYIPLETVHRLANPGQTALELIEVQSGSYLGEDDIVRLEDVYGR
ncbi:MAG: mannose-1-phosphate guanylyltransferase/mannose-6-phosphate isomerase, partial [Luminiphilus sp.]